MSMLIKVGGDNVSHETNQVLHTLDFLTFYMGQLKMRYDVLVSFMAMFWRISRHQLHLIATNEHEPNAKQQSCRRKNYIKKMDTSIILVLLFSFIICDCFFDLFAEFKSKERELFYT
ncbi:hypothetical protein GQX74_012780 [Glossina fuscipes]|nr:hypothetical protein GQX74_012780 [Glossina fuscipes]